MKARFGYLSVFAASLIFMGCGQSESTSQAPAPVAPSAESAARTPGVLPLGHPDISRMVTQALPPGAVADAPNPQWSVPKTWEVENGSAMRRATFVVKGSEGQSAEVVVSSFPGDVGGLVANVNRWRAQIGLRPVAPDEISGFTKDWEVAGVKATVVDFKGDKAPAGKTQPQRMIVVAIPHAGNSWFFKMTGDEPVVSDQKETFLQFVESVKF